MKLATKNFRLNSMANQFAAAVLDHVRRQNGGDCFIINADTSPIKVMVLNGVSGMRQIIDAFALDALKQEYQGWEAAGIALLAKCLNGPELTNTGLEIWESMVNDMGDTVAHKGPRND